MPVTLVQEADAASSTVTLGATATAGNTLVIAVACLGSTAATGVTGVTLGTNPDNFTLITPGPSARDATSPNDYINVSVWADANCVGGSTAIAVTGTGVVATWVWEFSGLTGAPENWQVFPVAGYHDSWVTALPQTTVPAEAWLAITCAANQTATETLTVNNVTGWTLQTAYSGTSGTYNWGTVAAYQTVNTAGVPAWSGSFSQQSFSVTVLLTLPASLPSAPAAAATAGAPIAPGVSASTSGLQVSGTVSAGAVNAGSPVTQTTTAVQMIPVGPKTGNYTAQPGQFVLVNCTHGAVTVTLPAAPANGSLVGVKLVNQTSGAFSVAASGSDVIDAVPAGTTSILFPLGVIGEAFVLQYQTATATWYTQSTGSQLPALPAASPQPSDAGYAAWSYDYTALSGTFTGVALPATGNAYLVRCPVRAVAQCTQVSYWITATGTGLTSGQNFVGVYSSQGAQLAACVDSTTQWGSSTGLNNAGQSGLVPFTVTPPFVWVAFLCNGTTGPSLAVTGNQTAAWANGRLGTNSARYGRLGTTNTSLPSSFSLLGISLQAAEYWVGLST